MEIEVREQQQSEKAPWQAPELKEFSVSSLTENFVNPGADGTVAKS